MTEQEDDRAFDEWFDVQDNYTHFDLPRVAWHAALKWNRRLQSSAVTDEHYKSLIAHVDANSARHQWYGPCDGLGTNGSCSECDKLLSVTDEQIQRAAEEIGRYDEFTNVEGVLRILRKHFAARTMERK